MVRCSLHKRGLSLWCDARYIRGAYPYGGDAPSILISMRLTLLTNMPSRNGAGALTAVQWDTYNLVYPQSLVVPIYLLLLSQVTAVLVIQLLSHSISVPAGRLSCTLVIWRECSLYALSTRCFCLLSLLTRGRRLSQRCVQFRASSSLGDAYLYTHQGR